MTPRVSVVVPTYRRPDLLARCLAALLSQDFDAGEYEIIVADNAALPGSVETQRVIEQAQPDAAAKVSVVLGTAPALRAAALASLDGETEYAAARVEGMARHAMAEWRVAPELPAIRCVAAGTRRGPAAARNDGWRAARGEIIAFTDDDCIPEPGWLSAGVETFDRDARVVGVSGRIVMPLPERPTDYELNATGLMRSEFVTANCFYRKAALEAVGGFDERFAIAWREDSDLYFTLLQHFGERPGSPRFPSNPDALVCHPIRPAEWGVSLQQQRRGQYNALLYKKHPGLYRERLAPVTPWHYYGIAASAGMAALGALSGRRRLAAAGMLAWTLLTARFMQRRLAATSHEPAHFAEMAVTSALIPPLALYWRMRGAIQHRVLFL